MIRSRAERRRRGRGGRRLLRVAPGHPRRRGERANGDDQDGRRERQPARHRARSSHPWSRCAAATASSGARPPALDRERRRESLVVRLDGNREPCSQGLDEQLRRLCLLAAIAAQRQRQADDDPLCIVLDDELGEPREPRVASGTLDDANGPRQRPGRVGDRHAGPRRAEVEREDLHRTTTTRERRESAARPRRARPAAARCPCRPLCAIVGRPPPPPPTSGAAPLITSDALMRSATAASKFATRLTPPSPVEPSTTAAGA